MLRPELEAARWARRWEPYKPVAGQSAALQRDGLEALPVEAQQVQPDDEPSAAPDERAPLLQALRESWRQSAQARQQVSLQQELRQRRELPLLQQAPAAEQQRLEPVPPQWALPVPQLVALAVRARTRQDATVVPLQERRLAA